eukprot:354234-Chlamydomonas_euryale.AAC.9
MMRGNPGGGVLGCGSDSGRKGWWHTGNSKGSRARTGRPLCPPYPTPPHSHEPTTFLPVAATRKPAPPSPHAMRAVPTGASTFAIVYTAAEPPRGAQTSQRCILSLATTPACDLALPEHLSLATTPACDLALQDYLSLATTPACDLALPDTVDAA